MGWRYVSLMTLLFICSTAFAQGRFGCTKDNLGHVVCAPAGGVAVKDLWEVVCAPGQCVVDNLGNLRCSSEKGGGASRDNLGIPVCVGKCINPSKEYCEKPGG